MNETETERRQAEEDRRIQELKEEIKDLREENRRLHEERRSGGDLFGTMMKVCLIIFGISVVAYFGIPIYTENQLLDYQLQTSLLNWKFVAGFGIWASPVLYAIAWFFHKK